jgi:hypothetical protein
MGSEVRSGLARLAHLPQPFEATNRRNVPARRVLVVRGIGKLPTSIYLAELWRPDARWAADMVTSPQRRLVLTRQRFALSREHVRCERRDRHDDCHPMRALRRDPMGLRGSRRSTVGQRCHVEAMQMRRARHGRARSAISLIRQRCRLGSGNPMLAVSATPVHALCSR